MRLYYRVLLFSVSIIISASISAQGNDWHINKKDAYFGIPQRQAVANSVCNRPSDLNASGARELICKTCPEYTSGTESSELTIDRYYYGSFSHKAAQEILLNTAGCEPTYQNFGGAILLLTDKQHTKRKAYFPGFNLEDCIQNKGDNKRNFLVCNEVTQNQGVLIGQISIMTVNANTLERWRLFKWYDNTAADNSGPLIIRPSSVKFKDLNKDRKNDIEVTLESSSWPVRLSSYVANNAIVLHFVRNGNRFFPSDKTQNILGELSVLLAPYINY